MRNSMQLGKIFGVEIGIHFSWLIVFGLVIWSLAFGYFPQQFPTWSPATYWIVATIASVLLFVSVLIHELSHSFVAIKRGMTVKGITLFIFGGVSNISGDARRPIDEFVMSVVGPLSSFAIAIVSGVMVFVTRGLSEPLSAVLLYLAMVNFLLGIFNLIPGFPLDGGRVLRSALWALLGSQLKATRIAAYVGQGIAYLFIFGGLFIAFGGSVIGLQGDFLSGLWLVFIGWFLANAAGASYRQARADAKLQGVTVQQLMNPHPLTVRPDTTVQQLVSDYILRCNVRALPVTDDGRLVGIVTTTDIKDLPSEEWSAHTVGEAMGGRNNLRTVKPEDRLGDVLQFLEDEELNQVPVVDEGRLVGLLTRSNLLRYLRLREELGPKS